MYFNNGKYSIPCLCSLVVKHLHPNIKSDCYNVYVSPWSCAFFDYDMTIIN